MKEIIIALLVMLALDTVIIACGAAAIREAAEDV